MTNAHLEANWKRRCDQAPLNLIVYLMVDRYPGMIPAILSKPTARLSCDKNMAEASKFLFTLAHCVCRSS